MDGWGNLKAIYRKDKSILIGLISKELEMGKVREIKE